MQRLPYSFAKNNQVILGQRLNDAVELIVGENCAPGALSEVRRQLGLPLRIQRVSREVFAQQLAETYTQSENSAADVVADVGQEVDLSQLMSDLPTVEDLLESEDEAPIIRMINALLTQAVREGASDVHIEPYESHSVVRFRRDGVLRDIAEPHRALHAAMSSRIKIMASLDIAEKRLPQDGRIALRLAGRQVDVRVSSLPTTHGERIVLRLLDKSNAQLGLEAIGMDSITRQRFVELLRQPHGIILVTGPTGSGKSTTLYSALQTMDNKSLNIVTVEDPVEYDLPGVGQIQVNPRIELDFAKALRAILRQDPDVIMIGEIRDLETAQIAVQASLTGHLVLATLHTNDAASAITRLVDMGVEPFLLASSLRGILAQRLLRKLCPNCKQPYAPDQVTQNNFPEQTLANPIYKHVGCQQCSNTGYLGRTGIYELLLIDSELEQIIHDGGNEAQLRLHSTKTGRHSLRSDGLRLIQQGLTSVEELLRVTREY